MATKIDGAGVEAISFDCFGTLIDWQSGLLGALRPLVPGAPDGELVRRFAELEHEAERPPYRSYKAVLEAVAIGLGAGADPTVLWRSLAAWPAFADTAAALVRLQRRFRIAIASNVDDDLWAVTEAKLGIRPDLVMTAERVRSYKPGRAHFAALIERLGLEPGRILHAGESVYHDIEPATAMGFPTVWVRRVASGPSASGQAAPGSSSQATVGSLAELADALGA